MRGPKNHVRKNSTKRVLGWWNGSSHRPEASLVSPNQPAEALRVGSDDGSSWICRWQIHESMLASVVLEKPAFSPRLFPSFKTPRKNHLLQVILQNFIRLICQALKRPEPIGAVAMTFSRHEISRNAEKPSRLFESSTNLFCFARWKHQVWLDLSDSFFNVFFWGSLSFDYNILPRIMVSFINRLLQKWREKSPEALRLHTTRHTTYRFFWKTRG